MKIGLVSPYDFSTPGGVTSHVYQLGRQLRTMGHEVRILAPSSGRDSPGHGDFLVPLGRPVPVPSGGSTAKISLSIWLLPHIRRLLQHECFDVIHLHEPLVPVLPLCVLEASRAANVGTFHAYSDRTWKYRFARVAMRRWFRKLDGCIACSPASLRYIEPHFQAEYEMIPDGIDVQRFSPAIAPLPALQDGRTNILFVGRLEPRKGLRFLVQALDMLKPRFPSARLVVVGPGTPDATSLAIINDRGLHNDVLFVGEVPSEVLPRYYRSADVFCSPATGNESLGIVLLEAMAVARPVVATNNEGFSSVVTHGENGLLVPPQDSEALSAALGLLIENRNLRETLGERGRQTVLKRYSWEVVAPNMVEYYRAVVRRKERLMKA